MAIVYSSEPSYFAANPKIMRFTGAVPGSRATFVISVTPLHDDPATRFYNETMYRYADANGVIEFDVSPARQRGAAATYKTPLYATNAATWVRNLETYFELTVECYISAEEGDDWNGGELTDNFIWGGTDMMRSIIAFNTYFLGTFSAASAALTRATTIEVNKYLPSFLLFKAEEWSGNKVTITATKGATSNALSPSGLDGQLNTQYLAATYAEGVWVLKRTDGSWWAIYKAQEYKMVVNNSLCVKEKVQNEEFVYLRWLNSLGGYSFGVFEVTGRGVAVAPRTRYRDYIYGFSTDVIAQSDTETLSKDGQASLTIGRGQVGWDQFEDLEDLLTSIEVLRWYPKREAGKPKLINSGATAYDRWLPVQISGGSSGDRSRQYNDFSCTLIMPQNFNQKR